MKTINAAHEVFQARHNWLSPLTSDEERRQFIARCCEWWNNIVCPAMDTIGAVWNEQEQCFELPVVNSEENEDRFYLAFSFPSSLPSVSSSSRPPSGG